MILREIQNLNFVIAKLNMLSEYSNMVKNGDVSKIPMLNALQDEINTFSETNINVLKSKMKKLTDNYNARKTFAENYMKLNRLTD